MHPIFPFIIDVSRVYFLITLIRFLVSNTVNNVCFNSTVSHFHKSGFVWSELRKNENIWFTITSHSLFQVVMCCPPLTAFLISIDQDIGSLFLLSPCQVVVLWDQWQPSKTIKSRIKPELMKFASVFCHRCASLLRQHLLTHWYDACCATSLTPLGVSVSSHFSSHRAERVTRGRLAELHSHE